MKNGLKIVFVILSSFYLGCSNFQKEDSNDEGINIVKNDSLDCKSYKIVGHEEIKVKNFSDTVSLRLFLNNKEVEFNDFMDFRNSYRGGAKYYLSKEVNIKDSIEFLVGDSSSFQLKDIFYKKGLRCTNDKCFEVCEVESFLINDDTLPNLILDKKNSELMK